MLALAKMNYHDPVLLTEILGLAPTARRVVDGTLGDGGHSAAFLERGAEVLAFDRDPDAVARAVARLGARSLRPIHGNVFDRPALEEITAFAPDLILLDLGVSSRQLDDPELGFSFRPGTQLDMRMDRVGPTAADLLNEAPPETLRDWFRDYGDEPRADRLAREIVRRRATGTFRVSDDFVNAIRGALGSKTGPGDFARLFQSVRIAVNQELPGLEGALPALRDALIAGGTLAAISYHSGEDRVVKHAFREWSAACVCPPHTPMCVCRGRPLGVLVTRHPIRPSAEEIAGNPRARSAKLRVFRSASDGGDQEV
ncbi:MAG: 16S rRNA (cytosine(1402)-N(4))-methyltransferase RsmH [Gemmatimonadota bacterium]